MLKFFKLLSEINKLLFKKPLNLYISNNHQQQEEDVIDGDVLVEQQEEEIYVDEDNEEEAIVEQEEDNDLKSLNISGIVTASALYVREGPSVDYNIIGCLLENDKINIIGQNKRTGWYKIEFKEQFGYVSNKYIFTAIINKVNDSEYGDGCEEIDEVIDSHKCCFKFNNAVLTQYAGDEVGAYGELVYDNHCAAHNLPYGTLLYIPILKGVINNTGLFTVMDTGSHGMDFDIYTKKEIGKINGDVYVVSWGKGPIGWSFTQAIEYHINNKTIEKFNSAWSLYNRMNGCTINFWKYKTDDRDITSKSWYDKSNIKQP